MIFSIKRNVLIVSLLAGLAAGSAVGQPSTEPAGTAVADSLQAVIHREAEAIGSVRSLLVQQDGQRLIEQYYHGMEPGRRMNTKSASKSIISLLVGIAIDEGIIGGVDDRIADYLPEYYRAIDDSVKRSITIRDLLTMRAGLETTSFHNYGAWVTSSDWVEYALDQPLEARPGGDMVYSTGSSHLLSVILTKASGMSTRAFANRHLFGPLEIRVGGWDRDPRGFYMGGNNLALSSEAMMRIGQMILNGGTWQGRRIVSQAWLGDSFGTYTRSNYNPYDYGYMWWNRPVAGHKTYFAWGYGGQYIFMIPSLDAVVVILSSLDTATQRRRYKEPVFRLLRRHIIPQLLEPRHDAS